tara:strand:+ start:312 stop:716 length:405 start_codon:yes stop_codon:yes gene_type:complete
MATSKNPLKQVDFTAPNIKAQQIQAPKATGQNYATADWSGLGEGIADIGDSVAKGMSASKNAVEEVDKQMDAADWKDAPGMRDKIDKSNALIEEDNKKWQMQMDDKTQKNLQLSVLQKLGSTGQGFKLGAFKNN